MQLAGYILFVLIMVRGGGSQAHFKQTFKLLSRDEFHALAKFVLCGIKEMNEEISDVHEKVMLD